VLGVAAATAWALGGLPQLGAALAWAIGAMLCAGVDFLTCRFGRSVWLVEKERPAKSTKASRNSRSGEWRTERMYTLCTCIKHNARPRMSLNPESASGSSTRSARRDVPGSAMVYEDDDRGVAAVPSSHEIPDNVEIGDHVAGYGAVLDIMPTADGSRLIIMENGSVLVE